MDETDALIYKLLGRGSESRGGLQLILGGSGLERRFYINVASSLGRLIDWSGDYF